MPILLGSLRIALSLLSAFGKRAGWVLDFGLLYVYMRCMVYIAPARTVDITNDYCTVISINGSRKLKPK